MLESYRQVFWELRAFLQQQRRASAEAIRASYFDLFREQTGVANTQRAFVRDQLGIHITGFVFIDPVRNDVVPLFKESKGSTVPTFPLPFFWIDPRSSASALDAEAVLKSKLVEGAFHCYRLHESINFDNLLHQSKYVPEYLYFMPLLNDASAVAKGSHRLRPGLLYVSSGEIAFDTYLWAHIVRLVGVFGLDCDVDLALASFLGGGAHSDGWNKIVLDDSPGREKNWLSYVAHEPPDIRQCWADFLEGVSAVETGGEPDPDLTLFVTRDSLDYAPGSVLSRAIQHGVLSTEDMAGGEPTLDSSAYTYSELRRLAHIRIRQLAWRSDSPGLLRDALIGLHECARFPIVAYALWHRYSPANRAHMSIPVWTVSSDRVVFPHSSHPTSSRTGSRKCTTEKAILCSTPIVGFALTAVDPIDSLEPPHQLDRNATTEPVSARAEPHEEPDRLEMIQAYLEILARPVVDYYLYVHRGEYEATRDALRLATLAAHAIGNQIYKLQNNLSFVIEDVIAEPTLPLDEENVERLYKVQRNARFAMRETVLFRDMEKQYAINAEMEVVPLVLAVHDVLAEAVPDGIRCQSVMEETIAMVARKRMVSEALENLILNSARAGATEIRVGLARPAARNVVRLTFEDNGSGWRQNEGDCREWFEYRASSASGGGSGVGLSVVVECAKAHGGSWGCGPSALVGATGAPGALVWMEFADPIEP